MKKLSKKIIGILLILIGATVLPQMAQGGSGCNDLCQDLCGDPGQPCQYTYCEGGTHLCTGHYGC